MCWMTWRAVLAWEALAKDFMTALFHNESPCESGCISFHEMELVSPRDVNCASLRNNQWSNRHPGYRNAFAATLELGGSAIRCRPNFKDGPGIHVDGGNENPTGFGNPTGLVNT